MSVEDRQRYYKAVMVERGEKGAYILILEVERILQKGANADAGSDHAARG